MKQKRVSLSKTNRERLLNNKALVNGYIKALELLFSNDYEAFYGEIRNLVFCVDWMPLSITDFIAEECNKLQLNLSEDIIMPPFRTEVGEIANTCISEKIDSLLNTGTDTKVTFYFEEAVRKDLQKNTALFDKLKKCSGFVAKGVLQRAECKMLKERELDGSNTPEKPLNFAFEGFLASGEYLHTTKPQKWLKTAKNGQEAVCSIKH